METSQLEHYLPLSFKYFVKSFSILKLLSKVPSIQTTLSGGTLLSINGLTFLHPFSIYHNTPLEPPIFEDTFLAAEDATCL